MKNRFVGEIEVTFPDGFVETCRIKAHSNKGRAEFAKMIVDAMKIILKRVPKGHVKVTYRGDCADVIRDAMPLAHKNLSKDIQETVAK